MCILQRASSDAQIVETGNKDVKFLRCGSTFHFFVCADVNRIEELMNDPRVSSKLRIEDVGNYFVVLELD